MTIIKQGNFGYDGAICKAKNGEIYEISMYNPLSTGGSIHLIQDGKVVKMFQHLNAKSAQHNMIDFLKGE